MLKFSSIVSRIFLLFICFTALPCRADSLDYRDVITDSIAYCASLRVKSEDVFISDAQYRSNFAALDPVVTLGGRAERYENIDNRDNTTINTIDNEVVGGYDSAWRSSVSLSGQYAVSNWYKKIYETG